MITQLNSHSSWGCRYQADAGQAEGAAYWCLSRHGCILCHQAHHTDAIFDSTSPTVSLKVWNQYVKHLNIILDVDFDVIESRHAGAVPHQVCSLTASMVP